MLIPRAAFLVLSLAAFLLGAVLPTSAHATALPLHPCILRAAPGMTARALFAEPDRFDCKTPQTRFGSGDFWVLSEPLTGDMATSHVATTASTWQDSLTLYVLRADHRIARVGVTSRTAGAHLRLGALIALPIPSDGAAPVRLLWHVRGATNIRGIVLGAAISGTGDLAEREVRLAGLYGGSLGMALAMLVCNLALWAALRQAFQPAYCMLLLCLIGYATTTSGMLGEWLPQMDNNDRLRLNAVFLGLSGAAVVFFARAFFEKKVFTGWLDHASAAAAAAVIGSGLLYALGTPWHARLLDHVVVATFILLLLLVPAILWRAWHERSKYLWLFAITWALPIGFAGLRIANALSFIGWRSWIDHSTIISMTLEALLCSLAIAYRIYLLSRERDQAEAREMVALQLAEIDPLTGLLNRRAFLARAIGRPGGQTLLLADIDHFKTVNDTIGHDGGDEVLRVFARALRAAVPADALVSRFGGEEFAIVVDADADLAATDILDRLRAERMPFDLRVTASIGTCVGILSRESDWNALYRCADRALFDAKASGRDRTRAAPTHAAA